MVVVTVVVTVVRVQVQVVLPFFVLQLEDPSLNGAVDEVLELVVLSPLYPAVVALAVLLVVEPLDVEPELQLIVPPSTWVQVWVNVDGLLSVLVSVLVWVGVLS